MPYSYLQLKKSGVPLLKQLLGVFGAAFNEPETYQDKVPSDTYLRSLLSKENFIAIVALNGSQVIGGLAAYVLEKFEQERCEIYIYDLAVAQEYRRQGTATGLILTLKQIARQRDAYIIFVQADKGDTPAIKLYESLGKKEENYNFDIPVDE